MLIIYMRRKRYYLSGLAICLNLLNTISEIIVAHEISIKKSGLIHAVNRGRIISRQ